MRMVMVVISVAIFVLLVEVVKVMANLINR